MTGVSVLASGVQSSLEFKPASVGEMKQIFATGLNSKPRLGYINQNLQYL